MILVKQNDLIGIVLKESPIGIHHRNQQPLTIPRPTLRHLENDPQGRGKTI